MKGFADVNVHFFNKHLSYTRGNSDLIYCGKTPPPQKKSTHPMSLTEHVYIKTESCKFICGKSWTSALMPLQHIDYRLSSIVDTQRLFEQQ